MTNQVTNKIKFLIAPALLAVSLFAGQVAQAQDQSQSAPPPPSQQGDQPQATDPGYNQQAPDQQGQQADQQAGQPPDQQAQAQSQNQAPPPPPGQPPPPPNGNGGNGDPNQNEPGVGRISLIHGTVNTQRADSGDVSQATLNTPLENGDQISTGDNSRTEVQLDFANVLRLAANSQATIATLDRRHVQVQVGDGLAYFSTYKTNEAQVEVDTPNVAIHPAGKEASFRLLVNSGGETDVVVRRGEIEVSTPDGSKRVRRGEQIVVRGLNNDVKFKVNDAPGKDDWDTFNQDRDRVIEGAVSWRHTNRYYTGSEDLDANGTWSEVPDYGQVWTPAQDQGWAPYSDGSWVYEPYYGWTWASGEPWGWAPYHYGRWFVYGGSWSWWPGPIGYGGFYRPIWAPAYVSFFGFGGGFGFGVGFGFGSFGWLPIGPCDFYRPWWGGYGGRFGYAGFRDYRAGGWAPLARGNRFSNLRNVATNERIRSGLSTVGAGGFGRGPVHVAPATAEQLRGSHVMTGNLPVVPSRSSLSASGKFENSGARNGGTQHFFTKQTPGARPASFKQETSHLQQSIQRDGHLAPVSAENRGGSISRSEAAGQAARNTSSAVRQDRPSTAAGATSNQRNSSVGRSENANRPAGTVATENRNGAAANRSFEDRPPASRPNANSGVTLNRQGGYTDSSSNMKSPVGRPGESARPAERPSNDGWERFGTGNGSTRSEGGTVNRGTPNSTRSNSGYRPPLQMNKPIVSQRPSSSYGSSPSRAPSNYGELSHSSAPGRSSAPSYNSGPRSAPSSHVSSGGGHSSGGGGSHSSGGGGGHSGAGGGGHH